MIPVKLSLQNFLSYSTHQSLDFSGFDLARISGPNGAGKSSLLEGITWALWGKSRAGSDDQLIHQGAKTMWVEFIFKLEENLYRVFRKRDLTKRGETKLEFQVKEGNSSSNSWQSITEPTIRQTQEKIIRLLHLPYEIFVNSSYLRQGHADEFTIKMPSERKEILGSILGLERYDRLEELAKEKVKELQGKEQVLVFQIEETKNVLTGKKELEKELGKILAVKEKLQENIVRREIELKKLEKKKYRLEQAKQKLEEKRERVEEIRNELRKLQEEGEEIEKEIKNLNQTLNQKREIEENWKKFIAFKKEEEILNHKKEEFDKIGEALSLINYKKTSLNKTIERIKKISICPTCLRPLSKTMAKKIITSLTNDYEKKERPKEKKWQAFLFKLGYSPENHRKIKQNLKDLEWVEGARQRLDLASQRIIDKKKILAKNNQNIRQKIADFKDLKIEGLKLKKEVEQLLPIEQKWQDESEKLSLARQEQSSLQTQLGAIEQQKKYLIEQEKLQSLREKELKETYQKKGIFSSLATAFSKKGIQAMIIDQAIPAIEEEANLLLGKITGGKMKVKIETKRAKKGEKEELIETLDIIISDQLGSRPYEMFSGGEAFRINFALRIALSRLLSQRAGAKLQFLAIDEGFGMLDRAGLDDIVMAINSIRDDFAKILIVSHLEELKELFSTQILVRRQETGSEIEVIGG